jgi:hypothetical protein
MGNELVAVYYISGRKIDIVGCWDNESPEDEFDFYDVYISENGVCLNEGNPFFSMPTRDEIRDFINQ